MGSDVAYLFVRLKVRFENLARAASPEHVFVAFFLHTGTGGYRLYDLRFCLAGSVERRCCCYLRRAGQLLVALSEAWKIKLKLFYVCSRKRTVGVQFIRCKKDGLWLFCCAAIANELKVQTSVFLFVWIHFHGEMNCNGMWARLILSNSVWDIN